MEDFVTCEICGKKFKAVTGSHLIKIHGISPKEYKKKYPGAKLECPSVKYKNDNHRRRVSKLPHVLKIRSEIGKRNKGKTRTEEFKKKRSEQYSGEGNPFYGKTHSFELRKYLSALFQGIDLEEWDGFSKSDRDHEWGSKRARNWRKQVYERDDYTCAVCGHRGGDLNAHHIKRWNEYPELSHVVENGITLCLECHVKTYKREHEFEDMFLKLLEER